MDFVFRSPRLPVPGETLLGGEFATFAGGKGANQAVAIGKLGGDVAFCGCVGRDPLGAQLKQSLRDAGVGIQHLREIDVPSGAAGILVDEGGENEIVVAPGANAHVSAEQVRQALKELKPTVVLAQLEIPMEAVEAASTAERFILNPAPARELDDALLARCYAISPNESEAEALTGIRPMDEASFHAVTERLAERGVKNVVITLGERGCYCRSEGREMLLPSPRVTAIDATGAGDCLSGALACFISEGASLETAVAAANNAAALSTTKAGTQASMPTRRQVAEFLGVDLDVAFGDVMRDHL